MTLTSAPSAGTSASASSASAARWSRRRKGSGAFVRVHGRVDAVVHVDVTWLVAALQAMSFGSLHQLRAADNRQTPAAVTPVAVTKTRAQSNSPPGFPSPPPSCSFWTP